MDLLGVAEMSMKRTRKVCWRSETGGMLLDTPSLALLLRALLFHITHYFYHYDPPQEFMHTPLNEAPQKCFQSGPALAKAGPVATVS